MDKKIAVVGMGQGGMVAAIKLARAGAQVTVFERYLEGKVSYPWRDDITAAVFEDCGLPFPSEDVYVHTQSVVSHSVTPWTVASKAPLSLEFSRQES